MADYRESGRKGLSRRDAIKLGLAGAAGLLLTKSSPASADYIPLNCAFPEAPILGNFVGTPVRVPNRLSEIQVRSLTSFPQGEYFYPIYDPNTANQANGWKGVGPHNGVAFSNIDFNAANLFSTGKVGELIVKANNGGRVAVSFYQEQNNQFDGKWGPDASGQIVLDLGWDLLYIFDGLQPGQQIRIVDPDTGRQMHWRDGTQTIYFANQSGSVGFNIPKTCGDARVQFVFSALNRPGFQPQEVKIRRGPNDRPELGIGNALPPGVVKPGVGGSY